MDWDSCLLDLQDNVACMTHACFTSYMICRSTATFPSKHLGNLLAVITDQMRTFVVVTSPGVEKIFLCPERPTLLRISSLYEAL